MKTKQYFWKVSILAAAAAAVLLTGCAQRQNTEEQANMHNALQSMVTQDTQEIGYLTLSVNPEIQIAYDDAGLVTALAGKNEEGKQIVAGYTDYVGQTCAVVVNDLIEKIYEAGYFVEDIDGRERNIVLQVEAGSAQPTEDFLNTILTDAQTTVQQMNLTSGVVSISKDDYDAKYTTATQTSPYITLEKAKEIALTQAGVKASDATFRDREFDFDDGYAVYELEFTANGVEYDYDVDALTGKVIAAKHEKLPAQNTASSQTQTATSSTSSSSANTKAPAAAKTPSSTTSSSSQYIGETKAKEIALNHAGVKAANAVMEKNRLDWDDGRAVYEVDFYAGDMEYDYEIDAITGAVREAGRDRMDYDDRYHAQQNNTASSGSATSSNTSTNTSNQTSTAYIGVEKAKSIALSNAGVSASAAYFEKSKLDHDDGRTVYEIEFKSGGMEYDYEIDAVSGSILKAEKDRDD